MREMLNGKKTYVVAFTMAALAFLEGVMGIDIPGVEMQGNWMEYILGAAGLGSLRAGVSKMG
jgi:hypothetical protein